MNVPGKYERLSQIFDEVVAEWPDRTETDAQEPEPVHHDLFPDMPEHRRRVSVAISDHAKASKSERNTRNRRNPRFRGVQAGKQESSCLFTEYHK